MQQVFKWGGGLQKNVCKKFGGWGYALEFFLSKVTAYAFITIILLLFFFFITSVMLLGLTTTKLINVFDRYTTDINL